MAPGMEEPLLGSTEYVEGEIDLCNSNILETDGSKDGCGACWRTPSASRSVDAPVKDFHCDLQDLSISLKSLVNPYQSLKVRQELESYLQVQDGAEEPLRNILPVDLKDLVFEHLHRFKQNFRNEEAEMLTTVEQERMNAHLKTLIEPLLPRTSMQKDMFDKCAPLMILLSSEPFMELNSSITKTFIEQIEKAINAMASSTKDRARGLVDAAVDNLFTDQHVSWAAKADSGQLIVNEERFAKVQEAFRSTALQLWSNSDEPMQKQLSKYKRHCLRSPHDIKVVLKQELSQPEKLNTKLEKALLDPRYLENLRLSFSGIKMRRMDGPGRNAVIEEVQRVEGKIRSVHRAPDNQLNFQLFPEKMVRLTVDLKTGFPTGLELNYQSEVSLLDYISWVAPHHNHRVRIKNNDSRFLKPGEYYLRWEPGSANRKKTSMLATFGRMFAGSSDFVCQISLHLTGVHTDPHILVMPDLESVIAFGRCHSKQTFHDFAFVVVDERWERKCDFTQSVWDGISIIKSDGNSTAEAIELMMGIDKAKDKLVQDMRAEPILMNKAINLLIKVKHSSKRTATAHLEGDEVASPIFDRLLPHMKGQVQAIRAMKMDQGHQQNKEDLTHELVLEYLFLHRVQRSSKINTQRLMQKIRGGAIHNQAIKQRHGIFFIGVTGSGKSTTVNWLLGRKLEAYVTESGTAAVRLPEQTLLKALRNNSITEFSIRFCGINYTVTEDVSKEGWRHLVMKSLERTGIADVCIKVNVEKGFVEPLTGVSAAAANLYREMTVVPSNHARIGRDSCESETFYSKGYLLSTAAGAKDIELDLESIRDQERNKGNLETALGQYALVDNPGFADTRGTDYEICTNVSIDRGVQLAASIRSVVLVVAHHFFKKDTLPLLKELAVTLKSRFPNAFSGEAYESLPTEEKNLHDSIKIIVTQVPEDVDASHVQNHLRAVLASQENKLEQLLKDGRMHSSEAAELLVVKRVLSFFHEASKHNGIHTLGLQCLSSEPGMKRDVILSGIIADCPGIDKSQYQRSMHGMDMKQKFGDLIEAAANGWTVYVFKPFRLAMQQLCDYPSGSKELLVKHEKATELVALKRRETREVKDKSDKYNSMSLEEAKVDQEFLGLMQCNTFRGPMVDAKLQELNEATAELKRRAHNKEEKMRAYDTNESVIQAKLQDRANLTQGMHRDTLKTLEWSDADYAHEICTCPQKERQAAYREQRYLDSNKTFDDRRIDLRTYVGKLFYIIHIERNYPIKYVDSADVSHFTLPDQADSIHAAMEDFLSDSRVGSESAVKDKRRVCRVKGNQVSIRAAKLTPASSSSHMQTLSLDVECNWTGSWESRPFLRIETELANCERNSQQIAGLGAEINVLQSSKRGELLTDLSFANSQYGAQEEIVMRLENDLMKLRASYDHDLQTALKQLGQCYEELHESTKDAVANAEKQVDLVYEEANKKKERLLQDLNLMRDLAFLLSQHKESIQEDRELMDFILTEKDRRNLQKLVVGLTDVDMSTPEMAIKTMDECLSDPSRKPDRSTLQDFKTELLDSRYKQVAQAKVDAVHAKILHHEDCINPAPKQPGGDASRNWGGFLNTNARAIATPSEKDDIEPYLRSMKVFCDEFDKNFSGMMKQAEEILMNFAELGPEKEAHIEDTDPLESEDALQSLMNLTKLTSSLLQGGC